MKNNHFKLATAGVVAFTALSSLLIPANASALSMTTPSSGAGATFTFNLDSSAFEEYAFGSLYSEAGMVPTKFWNTTDSNYTTKNDGFFITDNDTTPDTSGAFVHDVTAKGTNPTGQATGRFVKATTTSFAINDDYTGTGTLGMTGVQGFYLPHYYGYNNGSALFYGDFSLRYNQGVRQGAWDDASLTGTASGWYIQNNISFNAVSYDLSDLVITYADANNWKFEGNLLMSPENGGFLLGTQLKDMGNFCLGVGSYGGCSNPVTTSAVPVPGAVWLFGGALSALIGVVRRKSALHA